MKQKRLKAWQKKSVMSNKNEAKSSVKKSSIQQGINQHFICLLFLFRIASSWLVTDSKFCNTFFIMGDWLFMLFSFRVYRTFTCSKIQQEDKENKVLFSFYYFFYHIRTSIAKYQWHLWLIKFILLSFSFCNSQLLHPGDFLLLTFQLTS